MNCNIYFYIMAGNKKKDIYNSLSYLFTIIGVILLFIFIPKLDRSNKNYPFDVISLTSSICSIIGLSVTVLQLLKIEANSKIASRTFDTTISLIQNNDLIDLTSRILEHITLIKTMFDLNNQDQTRSNLNILTLDLSLLFHAGRIVNEENNVKLKEYIQYFAELESKVYMNNKLQEKENLVPYYSNFFEVQNTLIQIRNELKTPNNNG